MTTVTRCAGRQSAMGTRPLIELCRRCQARIAPTRWGDTIVDLDPPAFHDGETWQCEQYASMAPTTKAADES